MIDLRDPESREDTLHPRYDERVFSESEREIITGAPDKPAGERARWLLWSAKESAFKAARQQDPGIRFIPRHFSVELPQLRFDLGPKRRAEIYHDVAGRFRAWIGETRDWIHAVAQPLDGAWGTRLGDQLSSRLEEGYTQFERHCARLGESYPWLAQTYTRIEETYTMLGETYARLEEQYSRLAGGQGRGGIAPPDVAHGIEEVGRGIEAIRSASERVRRAACESLARALSVDPHRLHIVTKHGVPRVALGDQLLDIDVSFSHHGQLIAWAWRLDPERATAV